MNFDSDENNPSSSQESTGETDKNIKPLKKVPEILLKKQSSSSDSNDSGLGNSPIRDDIVTPETPSSPQTIGFNSKTHFDFSSSTSDDNTKDPGPLMTLQRSSSDCAQLFSHGLLTTIPEVPSGSDDPTTSNKNSSKSLVENCELEATAEKRPVVKYKTGLVREIISELQKKCSLKVKSQFLAADIYENPQDIEEKKEKERAMNREIEERNEKMKKLQVKELIKQMEKDLKLKKKQEIKIKIDEKDEIKKRIERDMRIQREKEYKKQREMELKILERNDKKIQQELEVMFQREMKIKLHKEMEMKKRREEAMIKQREEEIKKQRRMEIKMQKEMEIKIQREWELKKQREKMELQKKQGIEMKKQREIEMKKQREDEMEKIREIEAKIQREKIEMKKKKEKENSLRRHKETEDEINFELSFHSNTSLIEDCIIEMQERFNDTPTNNSCSIFNSRNFIERLSLDAKQRAKDEKYKTFKVTNYMNNNESHQKSSNDGNKENKNPKYSDLRIVKLFQSCENN